VSKDFESEVDMARHVVAYFAQLPGWRVYQEVRIERGGKVADIVDHHYPHDRAARCSLSKWVTEGVIKGVRRVGHGCSTRYVLERDK